MKRFSNIPSSLFSWSVVADVSHAANDVLAEGTQLGQGEVIGHLQLIVTVEMSGEVGTLVRLNAAPPAKLLHL